MDNCCPYCFVINLCINFVVCILMYKSVSMFLFDVKPSNNMDHSSKSILTEAAVKDKEYTRHLQRIYILLYRIYEQQTSATQTVGQEYRHESCRTIYQWALNSLPFEALVNGTTKPLNFSDLYDSGFWNSHAVMNGCAPLIDWEELLHKAPRKTILVLP